MQAVLIPLAHRVSWRFLARISRFAKTESKFVPFPSVEYYDFIPHLSNYTIFQLFFFLWAFEKSGFHCVQFYSGPCALWCKSGGVAIGYGIVKDGTRCTLNESPNNLDVCIKGSCKVTMELTVTFARRCQSLTNGISLVGVAWPAPF